MSLLTNLLAVLRPAADRIGPNESEISVSDITTSSVALKLISDTSGEFTTAYRRAWFTFSSPVDVYFLFGDSGVVADETAKTGDTRCFVLTGGLPQDYQLPANGGDIYMAVKGASASAAAGGGGLRIAVSSKK